MNNNLDVSSLCPDFEKLWIFISEAFRNGYINFSAIESDIFSAFIISILLLIVIIFALYTLFLGYIPARYRVNQLTKFLSELTSENLDHKRRELREDAKKLGYVGDLWGEFDETLVEVKADNNRLCNTIDSAHFFNNHTLAPRLTENRLLAAVPGFLTALGVIGTFAGLQMGLHGISFEGDIIAQQEDIRGVIAGAAVAFLTSVWGVLTSVLFNMYEKFLEQRIKNRISKLQNRIDFLFPRISPEQSLINIAASSRSSEDALNGLAERIGEQLQKAVTSGIQEAMQPAMDRLAEASGGLADRQAEGASEALSGLVEQFIEKISEAGEKQRELMGEATADFKSSISNMGEKLEKFSGSMTATVKDNIKASKDSTSKNIELAKELNNLVGKLSSLTNGLGSYSEDMLAASDKIQQASSTISSATSALKEKIGDAVGVVKDLSAENSLMIENTGKIIEQVGALKGELESASGKISAASETVANTFDSLDERQTAFLKKQKETLDAYEESMKEEFEKLTKSTNDFLINYTEMVENQTNERLRAWDDETGKFSRQMVAAVETLQSVIGEIDDHVNGDN